MEEPRTQGLEIKLLSLPACNFKEKLNASSSVFNEF